VLSGEIRSGDPSVGGFGMYLVSDRLWDRPSLVSARYAGCKSFGRPSPSGSRRLATILIDTLHPVSRQPVRSRYAAYED
jgi:hypothetical protein